MTPREWYTARAAHWSAVRAREDARALVLSRLRLATFLGGVVLLLAGLDRHIPILSVLGVAAFAAFAALVVVHARRLEQVARAESARDINVIGIARLDRDWSRLPAIEESAPTDGDGSYAFDLDVVGRASVLQWLGRPATLEGMRRLRDWLLAPVDPAAIAQRQVAVVELAPQAEWREALLTEGRRVAAVPRDLDAFLAWAESDTPAVAPALRTLVPALTVAIVAPLLAQVLGWTSGAWWIGPLIAGVFLSFALAGRIHRTFDRVDERVLLQYVAMLRLAEGQSWTAPALQELAGRLRAGGEASRVMLRLARLAQWSEMRRSAALLHFPIQAFTLWDFHVLFAMERWRARCGRHARGWFTALGDIAAVSTLAAVRHDEPEWCLPRLLESADAIEAVRLGHPLIPPDRRVGNDVTIGPPGRVLLITGSNMSGKSTLLRAIGVNVLLAHAGAPACAERLTLPPCDLQTSIRVQDSLERGLSFFMAALARLKTIVDAAERGRGGRLRVVYLLDEVLQGTNSAERAAAVRAIALHLLDAGAIGAMTTHDLAVASEEPFASSAQLVHFSEQVHPDGTMTFDYVLRDGIATSRNALRLMQLIGIEPR